MVQVTQVSARATLYHAAQLIEKDGWNREDWGHIGSPVCAIAAINLARGGMINSMNVPECILYAVHGHLWASSFRYRRLYEKLISEAGQAATPCLVHAIIKWNDTLASKAEVIAVLRTAAESLDPSTMIDAQINEQQQLDVINLDEAKFNSAVENFFNELLVPS